MYKYRCGPCKTISPFFVDLSAKYPSVTFMKVDVDQCPGEEREKERERERGWKRSLTETAARNGVQAMPTFLMFVGG